MPRFDLNRIGGLGPTTLRLVLQVFGTLCVIAGIIGVFVPLWPTTIFMASMALCSQRFVPRAGARASTARIAAASSTGLSSARTCAI